MIPHNLEGFNTLLDKLRAHSTSQGGIKVGLEAAGILFLGLEKLVSTLHIASVYALLSEFLGAEHFAMLFLIYLTFPLHLSS